MEFLSWEEIKEWGLLGWGWSWVIYRGFCWTLYEFFPVHYYGRFEQVGIACCYEGQRIVKWEMMIYFKICEGKRQWVWVKKRIFYLLCWDLLTWEQIFIYHLSGNLNKASQQASCVKNNLRTLTGICHVKLDLQILYPAKSFTNLNRQITDERVKTEGILWKV